ncbi:CDP-glucose 4,6-dehydratase [bacterium]|nr:CDP-glucose 4,6-dehydratase [bacterium]
MTELFNNIYSGKKILITGHTGFKGSWLSLWLTMLGADVCGYSLEPSTNPSIFNTLKLNEVIEKSVINNILDPISLEQTFDEFNPDIVFHLAAQPLVNISYNEPVLTYQTNVIGTLNVLEAARKCHSVKGFVNITTDKCYENKEINQGYKESDQLGGYDMYSSSKACVEILSSSYRRSFLKDSFLLATARAGNVIGGGDWTDGRLIPDCIRSINSKLPINLRNPNSVRPWQFVLEPLSGYLLLGQKLLENGELYAEAFNFGPNAESVQTVEQVTQNVIDLFGKGKIVSTQKCEYHEANILMLNNEKAKSVLGWTPTYDFNTAVFETVDWYKRFCNDDIDMLEFTKNQIKKFSFHFANKEMKDL